MALDGCGLVCKFILIIFNIIFAVLGFAFLVVGLWLRFSDNTRAIFEFGSGTFVIVVILLIVLGSVMLIVVAFGNYGACNEKRCALQVFTALLSILLGLEVAAGFLVYANRDEVKLRIVELYSRMYSVFLTTGDPIIGGTLTFIHQLLHCCGMTGVKLIEVVQMTCPRSEGLWEHIAMASCPVVIADVFNSLGPMVMGIFCGIGAVLLIALICSVILSKKMRQRASSPQYIILTHSPSALANPQPSQPELVSTSYSHPDQDPVVFTPLTVANIPNAMTQA